MATSHKDVKKPTDLQSPSVFSIRQLGIYCFIFFIPYADINPPAINSTNKIIKNQSVSVPIRNPNSPSKYHLPTSAPQGFNAEQMTKTIIPISDTPETIAPK